VEKANKLKTKINNSKHKQTWKIHPSQLIAFTKTEKRSDPITDQQTTSAESCRDDSRQSSSRIWKQIKSCGI